MIKLIEKINLSDCTLVIPSVGVGNVAQLAVDLLILNGKMKKIGYIFNSCFIPILGADPYIKDSKQLCTSNELYCNIENKLITIQIRSPPVKSLKHFFDEIKDFILNNNISKVIVLTSGWAHTRDDQQLRSSPMRYLASPIVDTQSMDKFKEMNWIQLETSINPDDNSKRIRIPGGGFSLKLFEFLTANGIPTIIFMKFCSEGDNVPDAIDLITYFSLYLPCGLNNNDGKVNINYPHSWEFLYGNAAPLEIY